MRHARLVGIKNGKKLRLKEKRTTIRYFTSAVEGERESTSRQSGAGVTSESRRVEEGFAKTFWSFWAKLVVGVGELSAFFPQIDMSISITHTVSITIILYGKPTWVPS